MLLTVENSTQALNKLLFFYIILRAFFMRVRHIITTPKDLVSDTGWQTKDLPPKHAPIFVKTRPIRGGWRWRSARANDGASDYMLTALCDPNRDNWKSFLSLQLQNGSSIVARFEHHGSHPGLHTHSDCGRSGLELGAQSLDNLSRFPSAKTFHRRTHTWTENGFWDASKAFFRIKDKTGTLI